MEEFFSNYWQWLVFGWAFLFVVGVSSSSPSAYEYDPDELP